MSTPYMRPLPYVYVPCASVATVLWVAGIVALIHLRKRFVVKERVPLLTGIFTTQLYLFGLFLCIHGAFKCLPSFVVYLNFWAFGAGSTGTSIFRAWRLVARYRLSHLHKSHSLSRMNERDSYFSVESRRYYRFWLCNKRAWKNNVFIVFSCFAVTVTFALLCLLVMWQSGQPFYGIDNPTNRTLDLSLVGLISFLMFLLFCLVLLLWSVREAFHMKSEFAVSMVLTVLAVALFCGILFFKVSYDTRKHYTFIIMVALVISILFNTAFFPIYYSRFDPQIYRRLLTEAGGSRDAISGESCATSASDPRSRSVDGAHLNTSKSSNTTSHISTPSMGPLPHISLLGILRDPRQHAAFRAYLVTEFSVENLVFWDEVELFRKKFEILCPPRGLNLNSPASSNLSINININNKPVSPASSGSGSGSSPNPSNPSLGHSLQQAGSSLPEHLQQEFSPGSLMSVCESSDPSSHTEQEERLRVAEKRAPRLCDNKKEKESKESKSKEKEAEEKKKQEGEKKEKEAKEKGGGGAVNANVNANVSVSANALSSEQLEALRQQCYDDAARIYKKFVGRHAPYQINLSHAIRGQIAKDIFGALHQHPKLACDSNSRGTGTPSTPPVKVTPDGGHPKSPVDPCVFDRAQRAIFVLMEENSYERYFHSPEYRECWRAARDVRNNMV